MKKPQEDHSALLSMKQLVMTDQQLQEAPTSFHRVRYKKKQPVMKDQEEQMHIHKILHNKKKLATTSQVPQEVQTHFHQVQCRKKPSAIKDLVDTLRVLLQVDGAILHSSLLATRPPMLSHQMDSWLQQLHLPTDKCTHHVTRPLVMKEDHEDQMHFHRVHLTMMRLSRKDPVHHVVLHIKKPLVMTEPVLQAE